MIVVCSSYYIVVVVLIIIQIIRKGVVSSEKIGEMAYGNILYGNSSDASWHGLKKSSRA